MNNFFLVNAFVVSKTVLGKASVVDMVADAGPMSKGVLLLLFMFSVLSWTIIIQKLRLFRVTKKENNGFEKSYSGKSNLRNLSVMAKNLKNSSVAKIYNAGYAELSVLLRQYTNEESSSSSRSVLSRNLTRADVDIIRRVMDRALQKEVARFEKTVTFLATAGSASPFIGLFGTVWGVMMAFQGIGSKGSASIAVVAPGISEALIATAAGLVAAVPAVIFYNYFVNRIRVLINEMEDFVLDFLTLIEKNFVKK